MQPIAAADVSAAVARAALAEPANAVVEIGGPEKLPMDEFLRRGLESRGDARTVVADPAAPYFGTLLTGDELTPAIEAPRSTTTFAEWLDAQPAAVR